MSWMMMRRAISFVLVTVVVLGACGGSGGSAKGQPVLSPTTAGQAAIHLLIPAGPNPSTSAKMICQPQARADIASALGVQETSVTTPTWRDHLYSCTYVYPEGEVVLSVKELINATTTSTYFDAVLQKYGVTQREPGFGQAAWLLRNDDMVVRKAYKVLLVDVQGIPAHFTPALTRADVARSVAAVIMGCWTGA